MRNPEGFFGSFRRQSGIALAVGLIFLLLMSIIGLYASRSSSLELRMAGNAGDKADSFENAEDARLDAETMLNDLALKISQGTPYDCGALGVGYYARAGLVNGCNALDPLNMAWDGTDSLPNPNNTGARYAIEYLGEDVVDAIYDDVDQVPGQDEGKERVYVFRVVGRGSEATGANSTIETIYMARQS